MITFETTTDERCRVIRVHVESELFLTLYYDLRSGAISIDRLSAKGDESVRRGEMRAFREICLGLCHGFSPGEVHEFSKHFYAALAAVISTAHCGAQWVDVCA